jgi:hypothetical protein
MVAFLRELAASQSVHHAARSVGMSRQSAYKLRTRLAGTPFALAWEVALEAGLQQLAHALLDRALNGEERPHYYHGVLVGTSRRYDNRLGAWLLDNPWKVGRQQVAREYVAEGWDELLDRIERGSLDWVAEDHLPGRVPPPLPEEEAAALAFDEDANPLSEDEHEEAYRCAALEHDQNRFVGERSWYAAEAAEHAQRPRFGRGRR